MSSDSKSLKGPGVSSAGVDAGAGGRNELPEVGFLCALETSEPPSDSQRVHVHRMCGSCYVLTTLLSAISFTAKRVRSLSTFV
jgi:hypothetical protein